MGNKIELEAKIENFEKNQKYKRDVEDGWEKHAEFLSRYPFRKNPEQIDNLSPQDIYNPGGEYFFDWIEHKLKV
ncbi:hypothetical protein KKG58_00890 [Patescibacteria group bacterium]|nr:hypothetical protein [Patescibacteria group bacterium]